ncbi:L-lactate permease [Ferrovibrio terrae]|uniref:L-lactate permease n=1 Tax=Ferrovibrio terrae TaxID=2594003 RepID=A0A516GX93_9PROT|nr:L-lactate permease [Ferrovibrio terrae]QDO96105.1 L-lactate permease [Ferrovibrio terrae]
MQILLYIAPIILVIGLVATGRVPLVRASLAGLVATVPAVIVALHGERDLVSFFFVESLKGAWLAWHAIAVTLAGLTVHHVIQAAAPERQTEATEAAPVSPHRRAFFLSFIASGLIECAIGFGVGFALAIHGLRRLGVAPLPAIAVGLLSQMLVPWGGLGIGTTIGAALGHLPLQQFGLYSASLMPPFVVVLLGWFWWWSHRLGLGLSAKNMALDLVWTCAMFGLLWLGNRFASVDTAGLIATAPLVALGWLLDRNRPPLKTMLRVTLPYLLLIGVLLSTRLITPLSQLLQSVAIMRPFDDMPAFPWAYQAGVMLLLTAIAYGALTLKPRQTGGILRQTWAAGRIAVATTLIFLVMARLMAASGIPAELAQAWQGFAGSHALLATPLFAAVAGGLTGSNTASNSLMLPLQAALAGSAGANVMWVSALQNVTGSLFTTFFPGKVAMACAFAGIAGGERHVYRYVVLLMPVLLITAVLLTLFL